MSSGGPIFSTGYPILFYFCFTSFTNEITKLYFDTIITFLFLEKPYDIEETTAAFVGDIHNKETPNTSLEGTIFDILG